MFLLGLLAFLQNTLLPGFIVLKTLELVQPTGNWWADRLRMLVYGFGLSLAVNYLLVFYLTLVGLYTPLALYLIVLGEILVLCYYYKIRGFKKFPSITINVLGGIQQFNNFLSRFSFTFRVLFCLAIVVLSVYIFYFFYFLGAVFMHWDPTIAWNPYAVQWASNHLPVHTWRYPQLMPTNWSISYVLMQNTDVQCFAKSFMPLFAVGNLLLFLEMALRKKQAVYMLGLIFYGALLGYIYHPSIIVSGYVDIGVSFFAFLAFHVMYSRQYDWEKENPLLYRKNIGLALFFAATAGITKQAGLFILAIILGWVLISILRHRHWFSWKQKMALGLFIVLTLLLVTGSWYVLKEIQIRNGTEVSEITMVQSAHHNPHYINRLTEGVERIVTQHPAKLRFFLLLMAVLMIFGGWHRCSWWVMAVIVIPYTLLWGLFFSYDARNLALVVPFMAFSAAFGANWAKKLGKTILTKIPVCSVPVFPVVIGLMVLLVLLNFTWFTPQAIVQQQENQKKKMGEPALNELLYEFQQREGIHGKIATSYAYVGFLPGLQSYYYKHPGRITVEFLDFLESSAGREIRYLLLPYVQKYEGEVYQRYMVNIESGRFRLIFKLGGYRFLDVRADYRQ